MCINFISICEIKNKVTRLFSSVTTNNDLISDQGCVCVGGERDRWADIVLVVIYRTILHKGCGFLHKVEKNEQTRTQKVTYIILFP